MSKVKEGNYIVIQSFMVNELQLKGNELLIYAIIYGFSQDEEQKFSGTLQYLADWTNSTKQGVIKNLKSLLEKGLIIREENKFKGVNIVEYYSTKFNGGVKQSLMGGIKQSLPNNIVNNNIYYNNIELNNLFLEYLELRTKLKCKNTDRAVKLLLNELNKYDDDTKIKMINNSIMNSWKSVYPIKEAKITHKLDNFNKALKEMYDGTIEF